MPDVSKTALACADAGTFDLLDPRPEHVSFRVITEHLAKASRYCGATPGVVYSVAEHSVRCARAAWEGTGDDLLAKYMLCHDMHEAYLGDDTTPKKRALGSVIGQFGILASAIDQAFAELTDRIDRVIHQRAGLAWPPSPEMRKAIKHWDRVLLATEWRDLMRMPPPYDFGCEPLFATIVPFSSWQEASSSIEWACWSNGFRDGP